MSFYPDDNLGFFDTVQFFFTELTERSIMFSGRDLELLVEWRDQGATARAVCRGIEDAVDSMPDDDPPRSVHACRKYVEPYVERARSRSVGRHDDEEEPETGDGEDADEGEGSESPSGLLERAKAKIERAGKACDRREIVELYRWAWTEVSELTETDRRDVSRYERLSAIEEGLVEGYYRALDRSEQKKIEREITDQNEQLLEKMSGQARQDHLFARRRRILIEEYDLISLIGEA